MKFGLYIIEESNLKLAIKLLTSSGLVPTIRSDNLIRIFGRHQMLRKGKQLTYEEINQIRMKLRFLARLLHKIREITHQMSSFSDFLKPCYYNRFVEAVIKIREEDKQLAVTLGHYIKQICLLNIAEAIKLGNPGRKSDCRDFLELYNSSWSATVASSTRRMQQSEKLNKTTKLPTTSDLIKFTTFLEQEVRKALTSQPEHYVRLQKLVMSALILYNKRRPAEVADMTISNYRLSFDNQEDRDEIMRSLSAEERAVAGR